MFFYCGGSQNLYGLGTKQRATKTMKKEVKSWQKTERIEVVEE